MGHPFSTHALDAGGYHLLLYAGEKVVASRYVRITPTKTTAHLTNPSGGFYVNPGRFSVMGLVDGANLAWRLTYLNSAGTEVEISTGTEPVRNGELGVWETESLPDGRYELTLWAQDTSQQGYTYSTQYVTFDGTPPVARLSSPANGDFVQGTVSVRGTVSDENMASWRLERSPAGADSWTRIASDFYNTGSQVSATLDTTQLDDGAYDLRLTARDDAGNTTSHKITLYVTNQRFAPQVSVDVAEIFRRTLPIRVVVKDPLGADWSLEVAKANTERKYVVIGSGTTADAYSLNMVPWDTSEFAEGEYLLRVTATNPTGNAIVHTMTTWLDKTPPVAKLTNLTDGETVSGRITLMGVTDDDQREIWTWHLSSRPVGTNHRRSLCHTWDPAVYGGERELCTADTTEWENGDWEISLSAVDAAGNSSVHTVVVRVENDRPPVVTPPPLPAPVWNQVPAVSADGRVPLSWTSSKPGAVYQAVRIGPNGAVQIAQSLSQTSFTDHVTEPARYRYRIVALDGEGGRAESAMLTVDVFVNLPRSEKPGDRTAYVLIGNHFVGGDAPAFVRGGRTWLPLRAVAEALGATVGWDEQRQAVKVTDADGTVLHITVGHSVLVVSGNGPNREIAMDTAPFVEQGRTYVPVRFLAEALGFTVQWDGENGIVTVTE